ncbi:MULTISPECIES: terminase small subunit [Pasteurella]|uniref:Terminase small subunit n=1 Tax=Pasteurella multocida (strain Pm70) TaxID=272843 RepID=Q9CK57_PASMU|nr:MULTISPECIES: terminase small subunit [Pasteurella]AAK03861.1 unknown [Pasteurella multocida subsp. multocida str. Pm70]MEB3458254.1 terminase small subunit [Pasteurella multocida]MEB3467513.1 terminase small subunit [Pasteurella multocida]MEB3477769.1 terminase small subunit [Pasteurella multocida]MEB3491486.1 terminase small subunit [Pasteurella multocida]
MFNHKLTLKQENFCLQYIETGNASEAYRQAYHAENMKPDTINRKASELLSDGKITARIDELKAVHQQRHEITVDDLIRKLEDIYQKAISGNGSLNTAVNAVMGQAKLLGLDKQTVKLETIDYPTVIELVAPDFNSVSSKEND